MEGMRIGIDREKKGLPKSATPSFLEFFSHISSDAVDMTFKITVVDQFGQDVLYKGGNGTGVEAELFLILPDEVFRKKHIPDAQRGRDRFGEGVEVNYVIIWGKRKKSFGWLCGDRKFRFVIIFDDISPRSIGPIYVFMPFGCGCGNTAGVASIGRGVENFSRCLMKCLTVDSRIC